MRALAGEWSLAVESEVEGEAGEADPVTAVEGALRQFPADEILLAGGASENGGLEIALRRFGLPVTRIRESRPVRDEARCGKQSEDSFAAAAGRHRSSSSPGSISPCSCLPQ